MTYTIMPTEEYTQDKTLQALIGLVGTGKMDLDVAQAATWHLTDNMSWTELAAKRSHPGVPNSASYFHPNQLVAAQNLVSFAGARARMIAEKGQEVEAGADSPKPIRGSVR